MKNKILAIIPARGGSKGIPRKNVRLLAGKPLVGHIIQTTLSVREELLNKKIVKKFDVAVTSEDKFIEEYVTNVFPEVIFIKRDITLSKDDVTLDPVIYQSAYLMEKKTRKKYDLIITMLPTTPLLSDNIVLKAIDTFIFKEKNLKSLILVKEHRHLFWQYNEERRSYELLTERKNRQYLKPLYEETGGIVITDRDYLFKTKKRVSPTPYLFMPPPEESIDINSWDDFILARNLLGRRKIGFVVSGSFKKGVGHVYRCINLAMHLIEHEIYFFVNGVENTEAKKIIEEHFFNVVDYQDIDDLLKKIKNIKISAIINDTRGINLQLAKGLKNNNVKIISINETNLHTSTLCDIIINPEFEFTGYPTNSNTVYLSGYKYNIARDDVLIFPIKNCPKEIRTIVITMGGSDPEFVTAKILSYMRDIPNLKDKKIFIIVGKYFDKKHKEYIKSLANELIEEGYNISIITDTKFMGYYLFKADLVITSNSSTVFDCVSLASLTITISKVREELSHLFPRLSGATIDLGYHEDISKEDFIQQLEKIIDDCFLRQNYHSLLFKYAKEIRKGQRVVYDTLNRIIRGDLDERSY